MGIYLSDLDPLVGCEVLIMFVGLLASHGAATAFSCMER